MSSLLNIVRNRAWNGIGPAIKRFRMTTIFRLTGNLIESLIKEKKLLVSHCVMAEKTIPKYLIFLYLRAAREQIVAFNYFFILPEFKKLFRRDSRVESFVAAYPSNLRTEAKTTLIRGSFADCCVRVAGENPSRFYQISIEIKCPAK